MLASILNQVLSILFGSYRLIHWTTLCVCQKANLVTLDHLEELTFFTFVLLEHL